jgi:MFS transporter, Spinster family, sphingosine-1-phosphate transporter
MMTVEHLSLPHAGGGAAWPDSTAAVRGALLVLGGVNLLNFMERVLFSVLLEPIKQDLALSDTQMGVLGGVAFALLYGVFGLLMGRLADTGPRVRILACVAGLWSLATAFCGLAQNFVQMFIGRSVVGIGVAGCTPCANSLIGDYFAPERRPLALSLFACAGTIGTLIGLVGGGLLLQSFDWRTVFLLMALPGLLFAPVVWLCLKEPQRGRFEKAPVVQRAWLPSIRMLLARRTVRHLLLAIPFLMMTVGVATWIPAYMQRAHALSPADVGIYGGGSLGLGVVLGTIAGGVIVGALRRRDRLWEFWWSALAAGMSVPIFAVFYLAPSTGLAYAALFLAFFVAGTGFGPSMACILAVGESSVRGTLIALIVLTTSLVAYGAGPLLVGVVSDVLIANGFDEASGQSLRVALLGALLFPAISAVLFWTASTSLAVDAVE